MDKSEKNVAEFEGGKETLAPFINTASGLRFEYDNVQESSIDIADIAHALSHICRFNGHTGCFYSVAQHSLMVSRHMPGTCFDKLNALLHDAAEAYLCDIPSPLKPLLGKAYADLYATVQGAINKKFKCENIPVMLEPLDQAACILEAHALLGMTRTELGEAGFNMAVWELWPDWSDDEIAMQLGDEPGEVEVDFLNRFEDLYETCEAVLEERGENYEG